MKRKRSMNNLRKHFSICVLAVATLLGGASLAFAQGYSTPQTPLGTASDFAVLGGTNVTCTAGSVVGDVGVSPGSAVSFTDTGCTITGGRPPATDAAAVQARADFLNTYATLRQQTNSCVSLLGNTLAGLSLSPGVYCLDAVAKTGVLTLTGPATGVWVFLTEGALTGINFSVVMAGGGQPCNVFWAPSAAATMTTSALKGNILAGNAIDGSITLTGGSLAGNALANVAVTITGTSVIGCEVLSGTPPSCKDKDKKRHGHDKDRDHKHDKNNAHKGHGRE